MRRKILAALSGGVDSAVAAALLQEEGYEVIGVTLLLWEGKTASSASSTDSRHCRVADVVHDARCIADRLGITHHVIDVRSNFRCKVVNPFIEQYRRGRTPNPCVCCNRELKFATLLEKTEELGAELLATGHYARVEHCFRCNRYLLRKGCDPEKDQSYMLFNLSQSQLARCVFPLGKMSKGEVYRQAAQRDLALPGKRDSQEICFIPGDNYREFLQNQGIGESPGPIVNRSGTVLGTHRGIHAYTVGQRRGLGLESGGPHYVLEIRADDNTLVVGNKGELVRSGMIVDRLNPIAVPDFSAVKRAAVKIRYRSPEVPASLELLNEDAALRVRFDRPRPAIAPGQAAVFYRDDLVLGGGIIRKVDPYTGESGII